MNWLWLIGSGLFGSILGAGIVYLLLMLAICVECLRRPERERDETMGWGTLLAWLGSLTVGLPLGAVVGVYIAWRHPEWSHYAPASFSAMGALAAIPLTWQAVDSRVSHFRTFGAVGDTARSLLRPDVLTLPNLMALLLLALGVSFGGLAYTLPPLAFWILVWVFRDRSKKRAKSELKAAEVAQYPLIDGSTLVVQRIECQDASALWNDPEGEGGSNSGLTFFSRVEGAPYKPGGTLSIEWRQENAEAAILDLGAYLCDADAPNTGVFCPRGGTTMDSVGRMIGTFDFQLFPRRAATLLCRVGRDGWSDGKELGSFTFPNPSGSEQPQWRSEELPVTRSVGGLDVTLVGVVTAAPPAGVTSPSREGRAVTQFVLDLKWEGSSTTDWAPIQISVSDATGNHFSNWKSPYDWKEGLLYASFNASHGIPDEVWKVQIDFQKHSRAALDPDERFVFSDIPLPQHGETITLNREAVAGGWRVRLPAALGIGAQIPKDFVVEDRRIVKESPVLLVECERIAGHPHRVSPNWRLSNGRGWKERSLSGWGIDGSIERSLYTLCCPADTDALELSASVRKTLSVEFLVGLPMGEAAARE